MTETIFSFMKSRKQIGNEGEHLAADYLERQGFQILERNFRNGRGEIDIIGIREQLLVFVEVKTRSSVRVAGTGKVPLRQQRKIRKTAFRYLNNYCWYGTVRFDVVEVMVAGACSINHYPGYFS